MFGFRSITELRSKVLGRTSRACHFESLICMTPFDTEALKPQELALPFQTADRTHAENVAINQKGCRRHCRRPVSNAEIAIASSKVL